MGNIDFMKKRLNSNVSEYDNDGNIKIFLEYGEKVVKKR